MPELTKDNGGPTEDAGVFSWNAPKKAVNPYFDPADVAPVSTLSNLITLYAADKEQEQLRREALSDEVWDRYFFNESRDPVQCEMEQDQLISRARMAREQQRFNPDLVILANVNAEPVHVSKPLLERIKFFQGLGRPKAYSRYLRETIRPCLERVERVRESQVSASFRFMASHEGLEGLLVLPEMNQEQVKRLSTLVAAHMSLCLDAACSDLFVTDDVKPEQIHLSWEKVAAETMRLDVIPPAFEQLRRKKCRRKPVPYDLIPGSLARMLCADWWYRKLWQIRCEWREEQLRAVCLVNRKASPYVSYEAVIHKREQRRKSLEFFQSHELVNADGDTLDMEDVVNASSSNPAHRRNEMMACVKGLELIAEMRGDCAVFYTITCPSRFHATLNNGRPNPKWTSETVRQSSDYLVDTFAAFRKAMHKAGLRWYGVRVAEPHHDGTVHWHLLCFMRKKDRRTLTTLLRKFAIREDRPELGNNTGPRFKSELINPRKGTPTSYIAKYISKNIDGRGLAKEISKETGKSLRDSAEHVSAWASLHRVQQFRFFGIPGRQAYRELRLLAGQAARQQADKKAGAPVLDNPRLDAVLAAADAGCFATYIMKQGGVLVPRKHHLVRTAYELNDEPSTYGDHSIRIYGIWSPIVECRICTHAMKWKMVRKAVDVQEATADQGAGAPWTRGNNCPLVEKTYQAGDELPGSEEPAALPDFENMSKKELRELTARLRLVKPKRRKGYKQEITEHQRLQLNAELLSRGFDASETEVDLLLRGGSLPSGAGLRLFYRNQRLQEDDKWRQWY
ncbi:TPA: replication endonuclease [Klebsiella pneumoniae]|uniref:replication endonuclease n=1 Tax=Klebsiella/Raoultella group TaxID=2890311 RepID=UPI0015F185D2|nr:MULTISPECIES: replication endonuclease [Klebsiella/Raoultella group]MBT9335411.1 replication endonuclease [Klebsiella sp. O852]HBX2646776.1 replication endonuclease [Klebsiella pneumoniae]